MDTEKKIQPTVGLEIFLEFKLPKSLIDIKCSAAVVHVTGMGFGVKFKNISELDQKNILAGVV